MVLNMKLNSQQVSAFIKEMQAQGITASVDESTRGGAYGFVRGFIPARQIDTIYIKNIDIVGHQYKDANNELHQANHDPRKTVAHEFTHILQVRKGYYERTAQGVSAVKQFQAVKAYNEVVANTVGMLAYPSRGNVIDNATYVNSWMKQAKPLMHHLKDDINELLPLVNEFLVKIGLK
jgi:hypothetical protein